MPDCRCPPTCSGGIRAYIDLLHWPEFLGVRMGLLRLVVSLCSLTELLSNGTCSKCVFLACVQGDIVEGSDGEIRAAMFVFAVTREWEAEKGEVRSGFVAFFGRVVFASCSRGRSCTTFGIIPRSSDNLNVPCCSSESPCSSSGRLWRCPCKARSSTCSMLQLQ